MKRFQLICKEACFEVIDSSAEKTIFSTVDFSHACDYYEGLVGETS